MLANYKVIIQFDGTDYCGWQYQRPEYPTIQAQLNRVLQIIGKKKILITGSSRTDAGVHSMGLTANFHLSVSIEPDSLKRAMNALLPPEIRIASCQVVEKSFNARFSAKSKTYHYHLYIGQILSPFQHRFAHHIPYPLDLRAMKKSLRHFKGSKDFTSFTSHETDRGKNRSITKIKMKKHGDEIVIIIKGKSFLRYMVRNIVGTLIDVGRGKILTQDIPGIFAARDRRKAGQTAPAKGLTLFKVEY